MRRLPDHDVAMYNAHTLDNAPIQFGAACWRWVDAAWREASESFQLAPDGVHVWRFPLDMDSSIMNSWTAALTTDERHRFEGFRAGNRKRQYLAGRIILRRLIGKYLGVCERKVRLTNASDGKPRILFPQTEPNLFVNLSHSGNVLLIAAAHKEIGIDVEQLRSAERYPRVARRMFPPAWLQTLIRTADTKGMQAGSMQAGSLRHNSDVQSLLFTRYWTACESLHKLLGRKALREMVKMEDVLAHDKKNIWGCHFMASAQSVAALTSWSDSALSFFHADALGVRSENLSVY